MEPEPIAETHLVCKAVRGDPFDVIVRIGRPRQQPTGEWLCSVALVGFYDRPHDIAGDDSLQALCLGLSHARAALTQFVREGGRLMYPGSADDYPIDAVFSGVGGRGGRL